MFTMDAKIFKLILFLLAFNVFVVLFIFLVQTFVKWRMQTSEKMIDFQKLVLMLLGIDALVVLGVFGGAALIMIVLGPLVFFCALMNYDWFMNNHRTIFLRAIFGREGTRIFYILVGVVIFFFGLISL